MTATVLLVACLGALLVTGIDVLRRREPMLDAMRAVSAFYLLAFVLVPVALQVLDLQAFQHNAWRWVFKHPFDGAAFETACLIAAGCYVVLAGSYLATRHALLPLGQTMPRSPLAPARVLTIALFLGAIGLVALLAYIVSIQGLINFFVYARAFRGTEQMVDTPWAFLKTVATLTVASALLLYGVLGSATVTGRLRSVVRISFVVMLLAALAILYHLAGRFPLLVFLLTFPLVSSQLSGRWSVGRFFWVIVPMLGVAVLGKAAFSLFSGSSLMDLLSGESGEGGILNGLAVEFSFPIVSLTNLVQEAPSLVPFRWFTDVPLAVFDLLPQRILGMEVLESASLMNTGRFDSIGGTVPLDLFSFGYVSAGIAGAFLTSAVFGAVIGAFDELATRATGAIWEVVRVSWVLFFGLRVLYGDPQIALQGGVSLIAMSMLLPFARERMQPAILQQVGSGRTA